jgi:hypothetical protein
MTGMEQKEGGRRKGEGIIVGDEAAYLPPDRA